MKLIKSIDWGRILLPAFLLIILIQGVMYLPEVRVGLFPEKVWQYRLRLVAKGCNQVKESLISLEGELTGLNYPSGPGFSNDRNHYGNGRADFFQVVTNTWYSLVAPTAQNSFEKNYYLARKNFFHAEAKLINLELMLDNLLLSTNSQRIDGIPYYGNHDTVLIQKQIHTLRQQCQQCENKLNIQAKRLQQLRKYADRQMDSHSKVFPPEIEK